MTRATKQDGAFIPIRCVVCAEAQPLSVACAIVSDSGISMAEAPEQQNAACHSALRLLPRGNARRAQPRRRRRRHALRSEVCDAWWLRGRKRHALHAETHHPAPSPTKIAMLDESKRVSGARHWSATHNDAPSGENATACVQSHQTYEVRDIVDRQRCAPCVGRQDDIIVSHRNRFAARRAVRRIGRLPTAESYKTKCGTHSH